MIAGLNPLGLGVARLQKYVARSIGADQLVVLRRAVNVVIHRQARQDRRHPVTLSLLHL